MVAENREMDASMDLQNGMRVIVAENKALDVTGLRIMTLGEYGHESGRILCARFSICRIFLSRQVIPHRLDILMVFEEFLELLVFLQVGRGKRYGLCGEIAEFGACRFEILAGEIGSNCLKIFRTGDDEKDIFFDTEIIGTGIECLQLECFN